MKTRYKVGDIVVAKSCAGDVILPIHHKLVKRIVVEPSKGNRMDWPGYAGWETVLVSEEEIKYCIKEWNIPYNSPGEDMVFVYDDCIIKRVKEVKVSNKILNKLQKRKTIKVRKNGKKKESQSNETKSNQKARRRRKRKNT